MNITTYSYLDQYKNVCGIDVQDLFAQITIVPTPFPLHITITQALSAGSGLAPSETLAPSSTLAPSGGVNFAGSLAQSTEYSIAISQTGGS